MVIRPLPSRLLRGTALVASLMLACAASAQTAAPSAAKPATPKPSTPAAKPAAPAAKKAPQPVERELRFTATVDATQDWKKNDPEYPGEQWSKGTTQQRYEVMTRLRSDGELHVRNILDPDVNARLEAKTIFLARQAAKYFGKPGQPLRLPTTEAEKQALVRELQARVMACKGEQNCYYEAQIQFAAIMAAIENPEALEPDDEPGRYQYFLPYDGCPEQSRITLTMAIDGVRYNKTEDEFLPFKERRSADTVNASDGLPLCKHFLAVIDTQDPQKPMYQETIFVPRPEGMTEYTENNHTAREKQYQPMPMAVTDWMNQVISHAKTEGTLHAELPLVLPLNGNATWLGLWTGKAKVKFDWSFREVAAAAAPAASGNAPRP